MINGGGLDKEFVEKPPRFWNVGRLAQKEFAEKPPRFWNAGRLAQRLVSHSFSQKHNQSVWLDSWTVFWLFCFAEFNLSNSLTFFFSELRVNVFKSKKLFSGSTIR